MPIVTPGGGSGGSRSPIFNVKDRLYGATGDGTTDDTAAIQAAIDAANTAGGGIVYFPVGTYIASTLTVYSNLTFQGAATLVSALKQKASSNCDFIVSTGFSGLTGGGTTGGVAGVTFADLEVNGNKSNQTVSATTVSTTTALPAATIPVTSTAGFNAGGGIANIMSTSGMQVVTYTGVSGGNLTGCTGGTGSANSGMPAYAVGRGIALYGRRLAVRRCWIHDCVGDGLWTEWSLTGNATSTGSIEAGFVDNTYGGNGSSGHQYSGAHDSYHRGCTSIANAFAGWTINATGYFIGCHGWGAPQIYSYFVATGGCAFHGSIAEVTDTKGSVGLYIGGVSGTVWKGGKIFHRLPSSFLTGGVGVSINGSSGTDIDTNFENTNSAAVYINSDGGNNRFAGVVNQATGPAVSHFVTTVAAGSNGVDVTTFAGAGTLNVVSTSGAFTAGATRYLCIATSTGWAVLSYTAVSGNSFTGVSRVSGSGTLATGQSVSQGVDLAGKINNDLSNVAASTVIQMVVGGGTNATNIDNTRGYTKRTGSITPSATINTYGSASTISTAAAASRANDYGMRLEALVLTASGIGAETLTVQINANTVGQGQTSTTVTLTTTTPYVLTGADLYALVQTGTPFNFQVQVKSSIGSSAASVTWNFLGWS